MRWLTSGDTASPWARSAVVTAAEPLGHIDQQILHGRHIRLLAAHAHAGCSRCSRRSPGTDSKTYSVPLLVPPGFVRGSWASWPPVQCLTFWKHYNIVIRHKYVVLTTKRSRILWRLQPCAGRPLFRGTTPREAEEMLACLGAERRSLCQGRADLPGWGRRHSPGRGAAQAAC